MEQQKLNLEKILPTICGSYGYSVIGITILTLTQVAALVDRQLFWYQGQGIHGVALNTTKAVRDMSLQLGGAEKWRGIFYQSDVLILPQTAKDLAEAIQKADKYKVGFAVPLKMVTGKWNVDDGLTDEQYVAMKNWTKIRTCGYGFYYGDLFANYQYHEGDNGIGEDWNFFLDNKINLYAVKLPFGHVKEIPL